MLSLSGPHSSHYSSSNTYDNSNTNSTNTSSNNEKEVGNYYRLFRVYCEDLRKVFLIWGGLAMGSSSHSQDTSHTTFKLNLF